MITYATNPQLTDGALNALFSAAWPDHEWTDFSPVLARSLAYVCAYASTQLVGFVNLAWDGGIHAFLLDTTVHPEFRRRGIGRQLVRHAIAEATERGITWVHVDFEPHLGSFYASCGFHPTEAGLVRCGKPSPPTSSSRTAEPKRERKLLENELGQPWVFLAALPHEPYGHQACEALHAEGMRAVGRILLGTCFITVDPRDFDRGMAVLCDDAEKKGYVDHLFGLGDNPSSGAAG